MSSNPAYPNPPPSPAVPPVSVPYGAPYAGAPSYGEALSSDAGPLNALDPLRLLHIARKKWLTLVLAAGFSVGAAMFYLSKTPAIYQSNAIVELSVRRPRILNKQDAMIEDPSAAMQIEETLNTQIEKFKGLAMLGHVKECFRELFPDYKISDEELTGRLAGRANFSLVKRTRLVLITFHSQDPEFAVKACNAYAAGAEASARAENRAVSDAAVAWLEAQAKTQKQELEDADKTLLDARQKYQMDVLERQRQTVQATLLSFNDSLSAIESKAALEQQLSSALEAIELNPDRSGELPADIPRAAEVASALDRWRAAAAERDALLSRYTPQHPAVEAQVQQVALYREQAMEALTRAKATTAANLALYEEQVKSLRQKKEDQLKLASELEHQVLDGGMKIAALERGRSAADTAYLGVLSRIQDARMSADENTATVKLVEGASPARQIYPRPLRTLFLALMFGLILGIGLAILTDLLEDHVVGTADIEGGTGSKILAIIPHVRAQNRQEIALASLTHHFSELAEAFAGLRSVLDSVVYRPHTQVILVASSLPEEGKTTTCCNLATACALNGQKTLLIDFDLRRPRVGSIFPMPADQPGLLDFLSGREQDPQRIVYSSECRNLFVMASRGSAEARPAELVGGARVVELLAWARRNYERIIIDAPPLGIVSDALSLAGLSSCVLVMARPATSRKRAVRHTIRRFQDVGVAALAVVMNDVDHSKFAYHGYGPYYHYRKHYSSYTHSEPAPSAPPAENEEEVPPT